MSAWLRCKPAWLSFLSSADLEGGRRALAGGSGIVQDFVHQPTSTSSLKCLDSAPTRSRAGGSDSVVRLPLAMVTGQELANSSCSEGDLLVPGHQGSLAPKYLPTADEYSRQHQTSGLSFVLPNKFTVGIGELCPVLDI